MADHLRILDGTRRGQIHPLPPTGTVTVGSGTECDVRLEDPSVDIRHCTVERRGLVFRISVAPQSRGVKVNDVPAVNRYLLPGDVIGVGTIRLRFECVDDPADQAAVVVEPEPATPEAVRRRISSASLRRSPHTTGTSRGLLLLTRIAGSVSSLPDPVACFEDALDAVCEMLPASRATVLLRGAEGALTPFVVRHNRAGAVSGPISVPSDLARAAADGGGAVGEREGRAYLCAPLRDTTGPVGAIFVDRPAGPRPYNETKLRTLNAVGHLLGLARERAGESDRARSAEREARLHLSRLLAVVDLVSDAVLRLDAAGTVILANEAGDELLGSVHGRPLTDVVAPADQAAVAGWLTEARTGRVAVSAALRGPDGAPVAMQCRIVPLALPDGGVEGFVFIARPA